MSFTIYGTAGHQVAVTNTVRVEAAAAMDVEKGEILGYDSSGKVAALGSLPITNMAVLTVKKASYKAGEEFNAYELTPMTLLEVSPALNAALVPGDDLAIQPGGKTIVKTSTNANAVAARKTSGSIRPILRIKRANLTNWQS